MAPELQILTVNALGLAVAYLWIYPGLGPLANTRAVKLRLAAADAAVLAVLLTTSGALFWGSGVPFRLLVIETNWFWFALATLVALDVPLTLWFVRRHGLTLDLDDDGP